MTAEDHLTYRPLRAPRESGTGIIEPKWEATGEMIAGNIRKSANSCYDVQGKCLSRLAVEARAELLRAARAWTAGYRDVGDWADPGSGRVLLAGHQPQMFHPGVWLKNFALGRLAGQHDAVGVNLIVDSDTIRSSSIPVPGENPQAPSVQEIPFDAIGPAIPYEEREILDRDVFVSFAERVENHIKPLVANPLVGEYWRRVIKTSQSSDRLGTCLAQGRHGLEGEWALRTLEIPQSAVCDCPSFRWFTCHLLNEADRFRQVHNEVLASYRRIHRIRSVAHPVADLAEYDEWQEAPFWIWTAENPRRRRLFVCRNSDGLRLSDRRGLEFLLPISESGDLERAVACLAEQSEKGVRLRSRALITTMWARLALGDLFLHGIGGAKYDQMTDAIIARFFGVDPPGYVTVSGTLHLPVPHCNGAAEEVRRLRQRVRRLEFQPERFLGASSDSVNTVSVEPHELARQKWDWIRKTVTPANYRERFLSIRRLNERLRSFVEPERAATLRALQEAEEASRVESILTSREYAFCLFSGEGLRAFFRSVI